MWQRSFRVAGVAALAVTAWTCVAEAAPRCRNTGSFDAWMAAFKKEALSQGVLLQLHPLREPLFRRLAELHELGCDTAIEGHGDAEEDVAHVDLPTFLYRP